MIIITNQQNPCQEGSAKKICAEPGDDRSSRKHPDFQPFYKPTHDQLAYPRAARGESADPDRLTDDQKLLLIVLDKDAFRHDGRCKLTNLQLGHAMGMTAEPARIKRKIEHLLHGRANGTRPRTPGLADKGFVRVVHDDDPNNIAQRTIERTEKWLAYREVRLGPAPPEGAGQEAVDPPQNQCTDAMGGVHTARGGGYTQRAGGGTHSAPPSLRLGRPEESSSSAGASEAPKTDDDDPSLRSWIEETADAALPFFGGDLARARSFVKSKAADATRMLGDRMSLYPAALRKALGVKKGGPKDSDGLHAYCLRIISNGSVSSAGPTPLVKSAAAVPASKPAIDPRWEAAARDGPSSPHYEAARERAINLHAKLTEAGWMFSLDSGRVGFKARDESVKCRHPIEPYLDELTVLKPFFKQFLEEEQHRPLADPG